MEGRIEIRQHFRSSPLFQNYSFSAFQLPKGIIKIGGLHTQCQNSTFPGTILPRGSHSLIKHIQSTVYICKKKTATNEALRYTVNLLKTYSLFSCFVCNSILWFSKLAFIQDQSHHIVVSKAWTWQYACASVSESIEWNGSIIRIYKTNLQLQMPSESRISTCGSLTLHSPQFLSPLTPTVTTQLLLLLSPNLMRIQILC